MSLNGRGRKVGSRISFPRNIDVRGRPTGGASRPQTAVVLPFIEGFCLLCFSPQMGDAAREHKRLLFFLSWEGFVLVWPPYAVRSRAKLWKSLRLARCMAKAASVSDWS